MRKLYFWFIFLTLVGLVLSLFLIPSKEQIARIEYKGKQMADAQAFYRQRYAQGDVTKEVILALVESELEKGNIDQAIRYMEEYVAKGKITDDTELQYLADLYRINQDYDKYHALLLKKKELKDTEETWRGLANWYRDKGDWHDYCGALQKLVDLNVADPNDYLELANCYIQQKDYTRAEQALIHRREAFLDKVTLSDLFLELWLTKQRNPDGKITEADIEPLMRYLQAEPTPGNILQSLQFFQKNDPQLLIYISDQLQPLISKNPLLEAKEMEILWEIPSQQNRVFDQLRWKYNHGTLDPSLYNLFFKAVITRKDDHLLHDMIYHSNTELLDQSAIYEFTYYALTRQDPALVQALQQSLPPGYLQDHPYHAVLLALGTQNPSSAQMISDLLAKESFTSEELYYLLQLASFSKDNALMEQIGEHLSPFAGLSDEQLFDVASIYVQIGKPQILYDRLVQVFPPGQPPAENTRASAALALLDIALNRPQKAQEWFQRQQKISASMMQDLFQQAIDHKAYPLASQIAGRLQREHPSPLSDAHVALSLVLQGDMQTGFGRLTELHFAYASSEIIESFYFRALVLMAEKSPAYRTELKRYIHLALSKGKVSREKTLEFAYLYVDVLEEFQSAETLFMRLVDQKQADKSVIETLVYLIGPHPTPAQFIWLVQQAQAAPPQDLGFWLENLLYAGGFKEVIRIFEQSERCRCPSTEDTKPFFAYLDALSFLERTSAITQAVRGALSWITEEKLLDKLAPYADYGDDDTIRRCIWQRLVAKRPCDPLAWQQLGRVAYDQHDYCSSACALMRFFGLEKCTAEPNPNLYESVYLFAEILERKRCFKEAICCYTSALSLIQAAPEKTVQMGEIEAYIFFKLEQEIFAIHRMINVYERASGDPDVAASVINMLLDGAILRGAKNFVCGGAP